MTRFEIRIVGFGGQGVLSLSKLITRAAVMHAGLLAVQTEAYSAAARGGKCWADCVIERDPRETFIDYPRALSPYDLVFILSDEASKSLSREDVKAGGWLVWDSSVIDEFPVASLMPSLGVPVQAIAMKDFGNVMFGSSILFGIFIALTGLVPKAAAIATLMESVPPDTRASNTSAFEKGHALGMARAGTSSVEAGDP